MRGRCPIHQKRENLFHAGIATARAAGQLSFSLDGVGVAFFEVGRLAAAFFRGPDSMAARTKPLFMPRRARSTLNLTAVTGRSCIPPGLTRLVSSLERVMGGGWGFGRGLGIFWPADDWNSPRVIRTCLRLRFMEIGGWFTSGWVSNGMEELSSNVNYWDSEIVEKIIYIHLKVIWISLVLAQISHEIFKYFY